MVDHYSSDKGVSRFLRFMYWAPVLALSIENRYVNDRESAQRLGLITLEQVITALIAAVENPPPNGQIRILDVPAIRRAVM